MSAVTADTDEPSLTGLTTLSVNCTPETMDALNVAATRLNHTHDDTINRAIQLYNVVTSLKPGERLSFDNGDEDMHLLRYTAGFTPWLLSAGLGVLLTTAAVGLLAGILLS